MRIRLYDEDVDEIEGYLSNKGYSDEDAMNISLRFASYINGVDFRVEGLEGNLYKRLEEWLETNKIDI